MKHAVISASPCACRSASCKPYVVPLGPSKSNGASGKVYLAVVDCDDHEALDRIRAIVPVLDLVQAPTLTLEDLIGQPSPPLTPRQRQILDMLQHGQSNKQIARKLGLSHFTVRNHVSKLLQIHNVHSRHHIAVSVARD